MTKIETLVLKYLHGLCSERELVQLRQAILVDPEVLHLLVRTAEEEVMLRELCHTVIAAENVENNSISRVFSIPSLWRRMFVAVAGILAVVVLGYLLTGQLRHSTIVELFTGTNERGIVRYEHSTTTITLLENTRLQLANVRLVSRVHKKNKFEAVVRAISPDKIKAKLNTGGIQATVDHKSHEREAFVILTPYARVSVTGTKLQLVTSTMGTRLDVVDGVAEFNPINSHEKYVVSSGEYAQIEAGSLTALIGHTPVFIAPEVIKTVPLDDHIKNPTAIASDGSNLWVVANNSHIIWKIDTTDGKILKEYNLKNSINNPQDIAWDGMQLWILDVDSGKLVTFDTSTERVTGTINVGIHWKRIAYGNGCIWGMTSIARKMSEENIWRRIEKINSKGKNLGFIEYLQLGRLPKPPLLPFAYMEGYLWIRYQTRIFPVRTIDGGVMSRLVVPLTSSFTDDVGSGVCAESDCIWFLDADKNISKHVVRLVKLLTYKEEKTQYNRKDTVQ